VLIVVIWELRLAGLWKSFSARSAGSAVIVVIDAVQH